MKSKSLETDVRDPQIINERNRIYQLIHNAIIATENTSEKKVFADLCVYLQKICNAKIAVLASFSKKNQAIRLEAVSENVELDNKKKISLTSKEVDFLKQNPVYLCDKKSFCLFRLFPKLNQLISKESVCYQFACISNDDLIAIASVQLCANTELKMKDLVKVFLSIAATILKRASDQEKLKNSNKLISEQKKKLQDLNQKLHKEIKEREDIDRYLLESKETFLTFTDKIKSAIYTFDENGKFNYVNPMMTEITEFSREELKDMHFWDIVHPQYRALVKNRGLRRVHGDKAQERYEFQVQTKSGKIKWVDISNSKINITDKKIVLGTAQDITKQKQVEFELQKSLTKYQNLIEQASEIIIELDAKGNILYVNPAASAISGYSYDELLSLNINKILPAIYLKKIRSEYNKLLKKRKIHTLIEFPFIHKNGSFRWIAQSINLRIDNNEIVGFYTISRDIHDQKARSLIRETRLQLMEETRKINNIHECLQLFCKAINDAELYKRSLITLFDQTGKIIDYGYFGLDDKTVKNIVSNFVPNQTISQKVTDDKFKISRSYFIPEEAEIEYKQNGFSQKQEEHEISDDDWHEKDELFIPFNTERMELRGVLSVDTPCNNKRPNLMMIRSLEEIIELLSRKINEILNIRELENSEEKFRTFMETATDLMNITDKNGNYIYVNKSMSEHLGYTKNELLSMNISDIMRIEHDEIFENKYHYELLQKKHTSFTCDWFTKSGKVITGEIKVVGIFDEKGDFVGSRGIFRDLTDKIKSEKRQKVLHDISKAVNVTNDLSLLYEKIKNLLHEVMDTTNFSIAIYNKEEGTIDLPYHMDQKDSLTHLPIKNTFTGYVIRTNKPLLATPEVIEKLLIEKELKIIGTRSKIWLGVPLRMQDQQPIGVMYVQSYTDQNLYSEEDMKILEFASEQVAIAISRKKSAEDLKNSENIYRYLYNSTLSIAKETDMKVLIQIIADELTQFLEASDCTVYLRKEDTDILLPIYTNDLVNKDHILQTKVPFDQGLTGKVAHSGVASYINYDDDKSVLAHIEGTDQNDDEFESVIACPLFEKKNVIGVITLTKNFAKFDDNSLSRLDVFARQAEITLNKANYINNIRTKELQLREVQQKNEAMIRAIPDIMFQFDKNGTFLNYSGNKEDFFVPPSEFLGKNIEDVLPTELAKTTMINLNKAIQTKTISIYEYSLPLHGKKAYFEARIVPSGENEVLSMIRDITRKKQDQITRDVILQISNAVSTTQNLTDLYQIIHQELARIIDTTNFYIALYDEKRKIITAPYYVDEFDKTPPDPQPLKKSLTSYIIDTKSSVFLTPQERHNLVKKDILPDVHYKSKIWLGVPLKIGDQVLGAMAVQSYKDGNAYTREDLQLLEFVSDQIALAIQKMQKDNFIIDSLNEKEILLKEVHHRVKNNIQVIASMLKLQSRYLKNDYDKMLFKDAQNRVKSMALVHEKLYQAKDLAHIDFESHVRSLVKHLAHSYHDNNKKISINFEFDPYQMDINTAIPCSLIINEMVSNSLKYAFTNQDKGTISIEFHHQDHNNTLCVKDDGIGFPKDFTLDRLNSMGLLLMKALTSQLHGEYEINGENGVSFKLFFKDIDIRTYSKI